VRRALGRFGWELTRSTESRVRFENFANLCQAYEQRLRDSGVHLPERKGRIKLMARLMGTPPGEAYAIVGALAATATASGDVCEFGVAQGETSALIANEIVDGDKRLHLFDSFKGLPKPTAEDLLKDDIFGLGSMGAYAGTMYHPEDDVRARLAAVGFPPHRSVLHRGLVEQIFENPADLPAAVSFAYVDFDFYRPTRMTLEFLDSVVSPASVIIVDDYDFFSTGSKTAVDEFVESRRGTSHEYDCLVPDASYGHFAILRQSNR
jgi:hypothetical protein